MRSLAWKEYREQRAVWLAVAVLALLMLAGMVLFVGPAGVGPSGGWKAGLVISLGVTLAGLYGVICAAMLLAGEGEAGTMTFLDVLAGRRTDLWRAKLWTGLGLTTAQALIIWAVLAAAGLQLGELRWPAWLRTLSLVPMVVLTAIEAFAWGLLASARCRTVLGAIGLSALTVCLVWLIGLVATYLAGLGTAGGLAFQVLRVGGALWLSRWLFSREDMQRASSGIALAAMLPLLWLVLRQGKRLIIGLALGLVLGLFLPIGGGIGWPIVTLAVGLVCGMATFAGEQSAGWRRFLADQRLAPGRVWDVKVGAWLAAAGGVLLLMRLGATVGSAAGDTLGLNRGPWQKLGFVTHRWESSPLHFLGTGSALVGWALYGFASGLLATMIARKLSVALVAATLVALVLVGLWLPSLVAGGLRGWQWLAIPVLFIITSRALVWPWAADQIHTGRAAGALLACGLATAVWMAGNLTYRAFQYPDVGPAYDVGVIRAGMLFGTQNQGGRLVEAAARDLEAWRQKVRQEQGPLTDVPFPLLGAGLEMIHDAGGQRLAWWPNVRWYEPRDQLRFALAKGWPTKPGPLGAWLDEISKGAWHQEVRQAADLPLGVVEELQDLSVIYNPERTQKYRDLGLVLAARALERQAQGQASAALEEFRLALAVSRQLRSHALSAAAVIGGSVENAALAALVRWIESPNPSAPLLRQALEMLRLHEAAIPPLRQSQEADYLADQQIFARPVLPDLPWRPDWAFDTAFQMRAATLEVPWERERYRRQLNLYYALRQGPDLFRPEANDARRRLRDDSALLRGLFSPRSSFGALYDQRSTAPRVQVALAVLLFEAEHGGHPPRTPHDLIPHSVPADWMDSEAGPSAPAHLRVPGGQVIVYHVSKEGEPLHWQPLILPEGYGLYVGEERGLNEVPAGRGVLEWRWTDLPLYQAGEYVVPPWPAPKRR